jgi:hypothetical protein
MESRPVKLFTDRRFENGDSGLMPRTLSKAELGGPSGGAALRTDIQDESF